jgi:hypothetical protein
MVGVGVFVEVFVGVIDGVGVGVGEIEIQGNDPLDSHKARFKSTVSEPIV